MSTEENTEIYESFHDIGCFFSKKRLLYVFPFYLLLCPGKQTFELFMFPGHHEASSSAAVHSSLVEQHLGLSSGFVDLNLI
jgi:hypothetical protein